MMKTINGKGMLIHKFSHVVTIRILICVTANAYKIRHQTRDQCSIYTATERKPSTPRDGLTNIFTRPMK